VYNLCGDLKLFDWRRKKSSGKQKRGSQTEVWKEGGDGKKGYLADKKKKGGED